MIVSELTLHLADFQGLQWAQHCVAEHHYLHSPVDVRCMPVGYIVQLGDDRVGTLIFGRPESTKVSGWYGSVEDVADGQCPLTRWQVLNLARVWLDPAIQSGGRHYIPNAATYVVGQSLKRIAYDYLIVRPPVWCEEPYEIRQVLSYCQSTIHQGTIYKASNFRLVRTNERGIETYARDLRRLTHEERRAIREASRTDQRARRLRSERGKVQMQLAMEFDYANG